MTRNKSQVIRAAIFVFAAMALSIVNPAADAAASVDLSMVGGIQYLNIDYVSGSHPPL
jgi:hypothetical protein